LRAGGPGAKRGDKVWGLYAAGNKAYDFVEYMNRVPYYADLRRHGMSVGEAMYWVKRANFDYSELSAFERTVMKRGVLFYGWLRNNIPYQLQKLLERPGGPTAQTLRTITQPLHSEETYVPSFLREQLGIRMGGEEKAAHFARGDFGLPLKDLNLLVMGKGLGLSRGVPQTRTFGKAAAQLHPLLTGPVEMWAGKQFWTGRHLKDMISPTERITETVAGKGKGVRVDWVDRVLSTSPASRFVSEGMMVADPRKSWWMKLMNATTGAKFSTYDVERWRYIDLINRLREEAGKKPFVREGEYYYVPKTYKQRAAGQEAQQLIRTIAAMEREAKALREKREAEEARGV
jgi:hypothetical protein